MADNNDVTLNGVDDSDHPLLAKIESLEYQNLESNRRISDLESENDSLSKSNLSLLTSRDDAERKIDELDSAIETLREEIEGMKREKLESAEEERKTVDSLAKEAGELESVVAGVQHRLVAALEEVERLRAEVEAQREEKGRMEEEVRRVRVLEKEKEELTHEVKGLVDKCAKLSAKSEESVAQFDELRRKVMPEAEEKGFGGGLKVPLPVVGAVSGVVIVAVLGVVCMKHSRRA